MSEMEMEGDIYTHKIMVGIYRKAAVWGQCHVILEGGDVHCVEIEGETATIVTRQIDCVLTKTSFEY